MGPETLRPHRRYSEHQAAPRGVPTSHGLPEGPRSHTTPRGTNGAKVLVHHQPRLVASRREYRRTVTGQDGPAGRAADALSLKRRDLYPDEARPGALEEPEHIGSAQSIADRWLLRRINVVHLKNGRGPIETDSPAPGRRPSARRSRRGAQPRRACARTVRRSRRSPDRGLVSSPSAARFYPCAFAKQMQRVVRALAGPSHGRVGSSAAAGTARNPAPVVRACELQCDPLEFDRPARRRSGSDPIVRHDRNGSVGQSLPQTDRRPHPTKTVRCRSRLPESVACHTTLGGTGGSTSLAHATPCLRWTIFEFISGSG